MLSNMNFKALLACLAYLSLPVFTRAASLARQQQDMCPVTSEYCTCSEGPFFIVNCQNVIGSDTLQEIVGNFTSQTTIFELGLMHSTTFPMEVLENPFLMSMIIVNSTFERLFDTSTTDHSYNSSILHHLSLENVSLTEEWSWSQLDFLKKLDIFFAYNTTIGEVLPASVSEHLSKSLKFLSISHSNITEIEPGSLVELRNLTYLRVSHSKLRTLTRNILPSPSELCQLRLDHNLITALPDNMFENMPNLTVVSLSNNRLSVLSEDLFRPLWRSNVYLELRNNPIKCDCRMKWLVTNPNKPNIIGECCYPKKLFRKEIRNLTVTDLNC